MTPLLTLGGLLAVLASAVVQEFPAATPPGPVLEIRSYNLKPGTRARFHELFVREALPLLRKWKIDVVGYGPSLHDADSYFLMRAFPSVQARERAEQAFYDSPEWRNGPRAAVLADIDSYTTIVIPADGAVLLRLRALIGSARPGDPGQEDTWRSVARRNRSPNP